MDLSKIPEPLRSKLQDQLERLPADVRGKLESQLAKLPAEQLEAVLSKTAPMLERLAQKSGKSAGKSSSGAKSASGAPHAGKSGSGIAPTHARKNDPNDHYNSTIGRGDLPMPGLLIIGIVVALVLVLMGGIGGAPG
jgi:hypothetical protein